MLFDFDREESLEFGWVNPVRIDGGGQADVWAATNRKTNRREALKVYHEFVMADDLAVAAINREARIISRLDEIHIIKLYGVEEYRGRVMLVMELASGASLSKKLSAGISSDYRTDIKRIFQVAQALEYAHREGVLHRDLKLENIMESDAGLIKVLDFGIATAFDETVLTGVGELKGTMRYMAPEVWLGQKYDFRSDIYSLGICLYRLLSNAYPFQADNAIECAHKCVEGVRTPLAAYRPDLPQWLYAVVDKMIAVRVENRFQTPTEVMEALAATETYLAIPVAGPANASPAVPVSSPPWRAIAIAGIGIAAVSAFGGGVAFSRKLLFPAHETIAAVVLRLDPPATCVSVPLASRTTAGGVKSTGAGHRGAVRTARPVGNAGTTPSRSRTKRRRK